MCKITVKYSRIAAKDISDYMVADPVEDNN